MRNRRKHKIDFRVVIITLLTIVVSIILCLSIINKPVEEPEPPAVVDEPVEVIPSPITPTDNPSPTEPVELVREFVDSNNYIYPFNTMSADWGVTPYLSGFKYYTIPQKYTNAGGCFPEVVQIYLWCLCQELDVDYYVAVALIERESAYKWDALSADGTTKGYMQIYDKWHKDRMQAEGVEDIYSPYGNIRVGLNLLHELIGKYDNYHTVLMSYNMGETGCRNANNRGIYSTPYSRGILERAIEIQQEIQG